MILKLFILFSLIVIAIAAECEIGYKSNWWGTCVDIDECINSTICAEGQCVNTPGSYQCILDTDTTTVANEAKGGCGPGYERNWYGSCRDIDECEENKHNCSELQECVNKDGSFECKCINDEESCDEVTADPCESNPCNEERSLCKTMNTTYECECKDGFTKKEEECEDINECELQTLCSHRCNNTIGSFQCLCPSGYELDANGTNCFDFNECEQSNPCEQECSNTDGSFVCKCSDGYQLFNGTRCLPIPEPRSDEQNQTNANQNLVKQQNSEIERESPPLEETQVFRRYGPYNRRMNDKCHVGFYFNRRTQQCEDIDECRYQLHNCEVESECRNNIGSFDCVNCDVGYVRNPDGSCEKPRCYPGYVFDDIKQKCVDFNECVHISPCGHEPCYNVDGAYFCGCYGDHCPNGELTKGCIPGFKPSRYSIKHCVDVDECSNALLNHCKKDEICVNTFGGYYCQCKPGLKRDRTRRCTDVDECKLLPGICYGTCINTPGSFQCSTSTADRQRIRECDGITDTTGECNEPVDDCGTGNCNDPEIIECDRGYKKNSEGVCLDIDECEQNVCDDDESCVNTDGGFICESIDYKSTSASTSCDELHLCVPGFQSISCGTCVDIDECLDSIICGVLKCENTIGSYRCVNDIEDGKDLLDCPPGYQNTDGKCVDIDECKLEGICDDKVCENIEGDFRCVDEKKPEYTEKCEPGFFYDKILKTCIDVNECQIEIDNCMEFRCENTIGSFRCIEEKCFPGYELVNGKCRDINECDRLGNKACNVNETCHNAKGAYYCQRCTNVNDYSRCYARKECMPGYEPTMMPYFQCTDTDECKGYHNCSNEEQCVNTIPGYRCDCKPGYTRNRRNNKCVTDRSNCGIDNVCPDLTQRDPCPQGFLVSADGHKCEDIDECLSNPCQPSEECRNFRGSYRCYVKEL